MAEYEAPVVAVVGQTAVGKSALALRLALEFGGEIVTADSRQVYKYMDIGTDKPAPEEQATVPHHLIDLVEPDEPYTLADYQSAAYACLTEIRARGRLPILAGGTPLYVNAVLEGWTIPRVEPDRVLRAQLEEEADRVGSDQLHARLAKLDPAAAVGILPTNSRRIIRALEVILASGQPMSTQQRKVPPPYSILRVGLTCSRQELYRRIDARVDYQVERGLVEEVRSLHERGYGFDLPSMSGLGYRQIGQHLQGFATLADAVQRIKWDTHAFARHQANWLKRADETVWLDVESADPLPAARDVVATFLGRL